MRGTRSIFTGLVGLGFLFMWFITGFADAQHQSIENESEVEPTIRKVALFFRHGERAPTSMRNNISSSHWPNGLGELTQIGKMNSYNLGKRMRKRYGRILTPYYSQLNATVLSTKIHRAMMSTTLVIGGMYPPVDYQVWNENIPWNPIPVFFDQSILDCYLCERLVYEHFKHYPSEIAEQMNEMKTFLKHYNISATHDSDLFHIYDALSTERNNNVERAPWADEIVDKIQNVVLSWMTSFSSKTIVQRQLASISIGNYLTKFIDNERTLFLYGNHDVGLMIVAAVLGVTLEIYPSPSATVAVEFHEINGKGIVRAFYIAGNNAPMVPVKMSCGTECALTEFKQMLINLQPDNYDSLCHTLPEPMNKQFLDHHMLFFNGWRLKEIALV